MFHSVLATVSPAMLPAAFTAGATPVPAFFGMPGYMELMIVGLIVLLLFGNRLPSVMRSLGTSITEFKKGINETDPIDERQRDEKAEERTKQA